MLEKNQIWGLFWAQPRYECDIYSYCGPFSSCSNYSESFCQCLDGFIPSENWKQKDQSGECVRRIPLRCEDSSDNSGEDRFLRIDEVKFPLSFKTSKVHAAEECKLACFNSCSCNVYAYMLIMRIYNVSRTELELEKRSKMFDRCSSCFSGRASSCSLHLLLMEGKAQSQRENYLTDKKL